jgi:hypothetical protein
MFSFSDFSWVFTGLDHGLTTQIFRPHLLTPESVFSLSKSANVQYIPCVRFGLSIMKRSHRIFLDTSVIFAAVLSESGGAQVLFSLGEAKVLKLIVGSNVLRECE